MPLRTKTVFHRAFGMLLFGILAGIPLENVAVASYYYIFFN